MTVKKIEIATPQPQGIPFTDFPDIEYTYLATADGTYSQFNNLTISNEIALFDYNDDTLLWEKTTINPDETANTIKDKLDEEIGTDWRTTQGGGGLTEEQEEKLNIIRVATAMPTEGFHPANIFVMNTGDRQTTVEGGNEWELDGWRSVTESTSNILNTDWKESWVITRFNVDTAKPYIVTKTIEDTTKDDIVITFNEALDETSVPATTDFALNLSKTVSSVDVTGAVVTLTVNEAYDYGDEPTVAFTKGSNPIQDLAGTPNEADSWSATSVVNNIEAPEGEGYEDIIDDMLGFAAYHSTTGGQGKTRVVVTNLNNSGAGSLREACETGNVWVSFDSALSGAINLTSALNVGNNSTIDGRGADITLNSTSHNIRLSGKTNIIINHIKFGTSGEGGDHIQMLSGFSKIWVYQCTFNDSGDEAISAIYGVDGVISSLTIQDCKFNQVWHSFMTSTGGSVSEAEYDWNIHITMVNNYFYKGATRQPLIRFANCHWYNNYHDTGTNKIMIECTVLGELLFENNIIHNSSSDPCDITVHLGSSYEQFESDWQTYTGRTYVGGHIKESGTLETGYTSNRYYDEDNDPDLVFDEFDGDVPPYEYTPETATTTLRDSIIANSGWQDVEYP